MATYGIRLVNKDNGFKVDVKKGMAKEDAAKAVADARKEANWHKPKEERVFAGIIRYVQD